MGYSALRHLSRGSASNFQGSSIAPTSRTPKGSSPDPQDPCAGEVRSRTAGKVGELFPDRYVRTRTIRVLREIARTCWLLSRTIRNQDTFSSMLEMKWKREGIKRKRIYVPGFLLFCSSVNFTPPQLTSSDLFAVAAKLLNRYNRLYCLKHLHLYS